jgi:hypothetical protein
LLGSPGAQWIADAPFTSLGNEVVWEAAARQAKANCVLEVLLTRGARLTDEALTIDALSRATPRAVELLAKHDMELSDKARSKIEAAWKERSIAGELRAENIEHVPSSA